ncbi:hypothetical protein A3860_05565 [Niastella vici]|uniref:PKD domain-containing protein n=1 Tax=Niastella vici TaxID=1703345 RepID=A0A1V9FS50_9BACT|nr:hypothetical protein [Niastella vici]OQP61184.1 hypothetical protein A3860_05565 [Niastella vici]
MKYIIRIALFISIAVLTVVSCKKKDYSLGNLPDKSQIDMEIKQDLTVDPGGNTVYLINHTEKIEPVWDYGTGRSMLQIDTIHYAFVGDYKIARSAVTSGGLVYLDTVTIHVTKDNLKYVNDPFWNLLTGGPGQEKTWVWDIDANGQCKVFDGPLFFSGADIGWHAECMKTGGDCWSWWPKYDDIKGWIGIPPADYGTMTFSLKGGPFVKVVHNTLPSRGTENGTFYLDKDKKTLTMNNATPLHSAALDNCAVSWSNLKLIELTDTKLQIGYIRNAGCGGAATIILNYYAK